MNLNDYQIESTEILGEDARQEPIKYGAIDLLEEIGEIASEIRKSYYKGNYHEKKFNRENLKSELGNANWNIALISKKYGIHLNDIEKEKYTENLEKEMILERKKYITAKVLELGAYLGEIDRIILEHQYKNKPIDINYLKRNLAGIYGTIEEIGEKNGITIKEIIEENLNKIELRYGENQKMKERQDEYHIR